MRTMSVTVNFSFDKLCLGVLSVFVDEDGARSHTGLFTLKLPSSSSPPPNRSSPILSLGDSLVAMLPPASSSFIFFFFAVVVVAAAAAAAAEVVVAVIVVLVVMLVVTFCESARPFPLSFGNCSARGTGDMAWIDARRWLLRRLNGLLLLLLHVPSPAPP